MLDIEQLRLYVVRPALLGLGLWFTVLTPLLTY